MLLLGSNALAQTITVDLALDDFTDFGGAQTVADLPGPDGHVTLREAVYAANNTAGPQTIAFAIPLSEWSIFSSVMAIIRLDMMLYVSDDETTLDFATQTAFTGDTNPDGTEAGLQYAGPPAGIPSLWIAANDCTVRGLGFSFGNNVGNTVWITGNQNRVLGCTTNGLTIRGDYGGGAFNVIGGTNPGDGNVFSEGVNVHSRANDNVLVGNQFHWSLRITGDTFWGLCERNRVGGAGAAERNVLAGHGYYGEEGFPTGVQLEVSYARNTVIQGNYVGTTTDGLSKYPGWSGTGGIGVGIGAEDTLVRDNLVAGIVMIGANHYQGQRFGIGIGVVASARNTTLAGNRVGLAADGVSPIPNVGGILVQTNPNGAPNNTLVGGPELQDANEVAFNESRGVSVGFATNGVRLQRNSIHDNGELGIDLLGWSDSGVTPNDELDADDQGGNHLQNFPVIVGALRGTQATLVVGWLESEPMQSFALDFYASPALDPSGFGEGSFYLGSTAAATAADGRVAFRVQLPNLAPVGWFITATATQLARGETSEFCAGQVLRLPLRRR